MSDSSDTFAANLELRAKEQNSQEQEQELLRNFHHRVAMDGSKDYNALNYLQGIAASLSILGLTPLQTAVLVSTGVITQQLLIRGFTNMRIVVFDILLSINAAANISLEYADATNALCLMYAPNPGQGYTMNSVRGKWLRRGQGLYVRSSAAINFSIDVSHALVEDVES